MLGSDYGIPDEIQTPNMYTSPLHVAIIVLSYELDRGTSELMIDKIQNWSTITANH